MCSGTALRCFNVPKVKGHWYTEHNSYTVFDKLRVACSLQNICKPCYCYRNLSCRFISELVKITKFSVKGVERSE